MNTTGPLHPGLRVRVAAAGGVERAMGQANVPTEIFEDRAVPAGASVRVMRGFYEGLELPLDRDWLVIGRGRGADLVIFEPTISRAHAAVGYREGGFFVQDLGSTNGTFLNGSRRERARVSDGDEIQMGRLLLRVKLPD